MDVEAEIRKARAAEEAGPDTLMGPSVGGDLDDIRRQVLAATELPVGNVPLYQAFCEATRRYHDPQGCRKRAAGPHPQQVVFESPWSPRLKRQPPTMSCTTTVGVDPCLARSRRLLASLPGG